MSKTIRKETYKCLPRSAGIRFLPKETTHLRHIYVQTLTLYLPAFSSKDFTDILAIFKYSFSSTLPHSYTRRDCRPQQPQKSAVSESAPASTMNDIERLPPMHRYNQSILSIIRTYIQFPYRIYCRCKIFFPYEE